MLTVISGTNRPDSNSKIVANSCIELLNQQNIEAQLFSLESLEKDFVFDEMYNEHSSAYKQVVSKYVSKANKFIFVIPEYHGGFPGVLKSFMDTLNYQSLEGKKAGLIGVSSGHAGALRPLDHFTHILHHLKMEVLSSKPKLSHVDKLIKDKKLADAESLKKISALIERIETF